METKPLLYGLIGFFLGGLIVSVAATTFDKPSNTPSSATTAYSTSMSQSESSTLRAKTGDDYDAAFLQEMIEHHKGAVVMSELSEENAKHDEIKQLSRQIVAAQKSEIVQMERWQRDWGYANSKADAEHSSQPGGTH